MLDSALSKLIVDIRKISVEEDMLRSQVASLREEVFMEESNVKVSKVDCEKLNLLVSSHEKFLEMARSRLESSRSMKNWMRNYIQLSANFKRFIERSEPTNEAQAEKLASHQQDFEKMMREYEESPAYKAILEQESADRDLGYLINEKRNEIMKLETEREF